MPANTTSLTKVLMGIPITVKLVGVPVPRRVLGSVFDWFAAVDARYSPYKPDSEVSRINAGLPRSDWSAEMQTVLALCEETKRQTRGYFDAYHHGRLDPSGLVKGWAIKQAADLLLQRDCEDFYIDAGGDIQTHGLNQDGEPWRIGIRNPFARSEIIKVVAVQHNEGVATSGAYIRGQHIYNPLIAGTAPKDFISVTVIGPDIYEADRFATAVYAMGTPGAAFIESLPGFEAYLVGREKRAILTSGWSRYTA
jgi:FAD:protein FMN transferase